MHYEDFDVVLPTRRPMAPPPVIAVEAFRRLSEDDKARVLDYIRTTYGPEAFQANGRKEFPLGAMLGGLSLLIFTLCWAWAWWAIALTPR